MLPQLPYRRSRHRVTCILGRAVSEPCVGRDLWALFSHPLCEKCLKPVHSACSTPTAPARRSHGSHSARRAAERARAAGIAFSKLSGDEQGIILGQLRNALEPRLVMYFSSASKELRALLPPAQQQQL